MKQLITFVTCILACAFVGFLSSRFQADSLVDWYPTLIKSKLSPPGIAFSIAWTLLYILMGVSIGLIILERGSWRRIAVILFVVQLILNFTWSIAFFYLKSPLLGLINLTLLILCVYAYGMHSYWVNRKAAYLIIPYLAWLLFAAYLNAYIYLYN